MTRERQGLEVLHSGRWIEMVRLDGWEWVRRAHNDDVVAIVAVTNAQKLVLVEQHRTPVDAPCIELPAGLVGDAHYRGESLEAAAERELLEETGYAAELMTMLCQGPASPGLTTECTNFLLARGLRKVAPGGGDESEDITIHEVPLQDLHTFLESARKRGALVDPKIFAGLYFLGSRPVSPSERSLELPLIETPGAPERPRFTREVLEALDRALPSGAQTRRVGVFGGSFNPPHVGHALLAHSILATEPLDELWIIPVLAHPFGKAAASFEHRLAMCRLAFGMLGDRVKVMDIERHLPTPSYTVQTLEALHAARPGIKPTLIIGSDILPELDRWEEPHRLPQLSQIVVVPRAGAPDIEARDGFEMKVYRGFRLPRVSSTAVQKALSSGADVDGWLDKTVLDYIREHELYGGS